MLSLENRAAARFQQTFLTVFLTVFVPGAFMIGQYRHSDRQGLSKPMNQGVY
jgi:hypothetical protein